MKKLLILATIIGCSAIAQAAETPSKTVEQFSCEDFLALDAQYQPVVTGYALAYNQKGQLESGFIDVDGIETVTPELGAVCKTEPKASFLQEIKNIIEGKK